MYGSIRTIPFDKRSGYGSGLHSLKMGSRWTSTKQQDSLQARGKESYVIGQ